MASCTYQGDASAPIPFARGSMPPLRVQVDPPADGTNARVQGTLTDDLADRRPSGRPTLVVRAGEYTR